MQTTTKLTIKTIEWQEPLRKRFLTAFIAHVKEWAEHPWELKGSRNAANEAWVCVRKFSPETIDCERIAVMMADYHLNRVWAVGPPPTV